DIWLPDPLWAAVFYIWVALMLLRIARDMRRASRVIENRSGVLYAFFLTLPEPELDRATCRDMPGERVALRQYLSRYSKLEKLIDMLFLLFPWCAYMLQCILDPRQIAAQLL